MDPSETQDLHSPDDPIPSATDHEAAGHPLSVILEPFQWIRMLCQELNASFVLGVALVYGLSQGFAWSFLRVAADYYWKDVQQVQPSMVQMFAGLYYIPWVMKPIWGVLTDVVPVLGYRRRPYFILAGILGVATTFVLSTFGKLPIILALLCLIGIMASIAIADVTIDACIATNSIERPKLAPDMQSLCGFLSSLGALIGYSTSGFFIHHLGAQGALGLMSIPPVSLILLGFVIFELRTNHWSDKQEVWEKVGGAIRVIGRTMQYPTVWKSSLYMYLSLALSISTHEGHFYWYTDRKAGPAFSQEFVGMIYAIGAMASMVGVLIYHKLLKDYQFRSLLFYAQLLFAVSGMLDLIFVLRWNLKLGIPDYFFVILEECSVRITGRIRWMPMMVLSTKLCPPGIEGTFFALLMCIDSLGGLTSKTGGGMALHLFHVTRTDFRNLWLAVLVRNLLRIATLGLIFLIPKANQSSVLLPPDLLKKSDSDEEESLQLTTMNQKEDI
uniref:Probable folate-biopterin transporter 6 n=1 Tax=Elaeis guineensis var. tenera TaxID=51953 RepID=A0A6I9Q920_ELAGV|nr:probable folate-biopterin transporter 6 [Elaeis guineensis]